jgi:hypothetical protein
MRCSLCAEAALPPGTLFAYANPKTRSPENHRATISRNANRMRRNVACRRRFLEYDILKFFCARP